MRREEIFGLDAKEKGARGMGTEGAGEKGKKDGGRPAEQRSTA
jgi:hypothetical protein